MFGGRCQVTWSARCLTSRCWCAASLLRSHWKGKLSGEELLATAAKVDVDAWRLQRDAGIDFVALDGTLYDQAWRLTHKRNQSLVAYQLKSCLQSNLCNLGSTLPSGSEFSPSDLCTVAILLILAQIRAQCHPMS